MNGKVNSARLLLPPKPSAVTRTGWDVYLRGLPAQQQVRGCDLVILHLGQRVLDLLQVVAHSHHHICTEEEQTVAC